MEAVNGERLSVGRPWFDFFGMVLGLGLLGLMAVAPVLPWRKAHAATLAQRLQWPAWTGTAGRGRGRRTSWARGFAPLAAFGLGGFAAGAALRQVALATRRQGWRGLVGRTNGGMIVHLGVVLLVVGYVASSSFQTSREVRLQPGQTITVEGHRLEYLGSSTSIDARRTSIAARVRVDDGRVYTPSLRRFPNNAQAIGTPSVRTSIVDDVYLSLLTSPEQDDAVTLRIIIEPLAVWMWIGGAVIAVGTVLAAWPGRRRNPTDPVSAPVAVRRGAARDTEEETPELTGVT